MRLLDSAVAISAAGLLLLLAGCGPGHARSAAEALAISRAAVAFIHSDLGAPAALAVEFACAIEPAAPNRACAEPDFDAIADSIAQDLGALRLARPEPHPCDGTALVPPECTGWVLTLERPQVERRNARMLISVRGAAYDAEDGTYSLLSHDRLLHLERGQAGWQVVEAVSEWFS
jgi:hypothetical protein